MFITSSIDKKCYHHQLQLPHTREWFKETFEAQICKILRNPRLDTLLRILIKKRVIEFYVITQRKRKRLSFHMGHPVHSSSSSSSYQVKHVRKKVDKQSTLVISTYSSLSWAFQPCVGKNTLVNSTTRYLPSLPVPWTNFIMLSRPFRYFFVFISIEKSGSEMIFQTIHSL